MPEMDPLNTYWNATRQDNFTTATEAGRLAAAAAGYRFIRNEGWIPRGDRPAPDATSYAPLENYWSGERSDNFLTGSDAGRAEATRAGSGYQLLRREGWIWKVGNEPLKLWWNAERRDNYTTGSPAGADAATQAGYRFIRNEGHLADQPTGLCLFWNEGRRDNFTSSTNEGRLAAAQAGYRFIRREYGFRAQLPGTVPLKLYWNASRQDNFTLANPASEAAAWQAGYTFIRVEGWVYPTLSAIPSGASFRREVRTYWHQDRLDNILTIEGEETERVARAAGYRFERVEGYFAIEIS